MSTAHRHGIQVFACALVAAGLFGMYHEPAPENPALLAAHLLHFKAWGVVAAIGCLMFNPGRLSRGLMGVAQAWKAKS